MQILAIVSCTLLCLAVSISAIGPKGSSELFTVYQIIPKSASVLQFLSDLWKKSSHYDLDFWRPPSTVNSEVHVMVGPGWRTEFIDSMNAMNATMEMRIPDVNKLIEQKQSSLFSHIRGSRTKRRTSFGPAFDLSKFHSFNEIVHHMADLQRRFPGWMQVLNIGTTHEGRPMHVAKLGTPKQNAPFGRNGKPAIWIDAGIHAREWVSPATAIYFIDRLANRYNSDSNIRYLLDNLDWYILPVMNPDGYEHSRSSNDARTRLWRKNKSPCVQNKNGFFGTFAGQSGECCRHCSILIKGGEITNAPLCSAGYCHYKLQNASRPYKVYLLKGVDLNRNFDFHWGESGSSNDPCEEIFQGATPFSEPETRAIRDFITRGNVNFQGFITMHSYSQIWMYPYGHQRRQYPADVADLKTVALKARAALAAIYGTDYKVGTGADTLYPASGGSDDWAKDKAGIKYVYLLELRPEDHVWDGFIIGESEIIPTAQETFAGIRVVADSILQRNNIQPISGNQIITNTVRPPRPLVRPVESCRNTDTHCEAWAAAGACHAWRELMQQRCAKSCGHCSDNNAITPATRSSGGDSNSSSVTGTCTDTRADCKAWNRMGLCSWVKKSCRLTCGHCR